MPRQPALVCIIMVWSKEMLQVLVVPPFFKKKNIASIASIAYLWKVEMMKDVYLYLRSHFELLHLEILSFGPFSLYLLRKQFRGGGVGGLSDSLALQKLESPLVLQHDWGAAEVLIWCTFRWIIWCIDWLDDGTSPIRHHHYHPPMLLIISKLNVSHTQAIPAHFLVRKDEGTLDAASLPPPSPPCPALPRWRTPGSSPPPPARAPHSRNRRLTEVQSRLASHQPTTIAHLSFVFCIKDMFLPPGDWWFGSRWTFACSPTPAHVAWKSQSGKIESENTCLTVSWSCWWESESERIMMRRWKWDEKIWKEDMMRKWKQDDMIRKWKWEDKRRKWKWDHLSLSLLISLMRTSGLGVLDGKGWKKIVWTKW